MGTKYLSTVALICVAAYVVALGVASYRLGTTISERKTIAEKEFAELVDSASSAAVLGFMDEPFRETVRDTVRSSHALAAAIVTGPRGAEYAIERESGYLVGMEGEPRFVVSFGASRSPLFAPLRAGGVRNATVSATVLLIDKLEFFVILRDTLLAIAVIAMLGATTLIVDVLQSQETALGTAETKAGATANAPAETETGGDASGNVRAGNGAIDKTENALEEIVFDIDIPDLASDVKAEIMEESEDYAKADANAPRPLESSPIVTAEAVDLRTEAAPSGLYSPRSDIGWEAYAGDRLASELHRCASFEQDLVLIMMEPKTDGEAWEAVFADFAESTVSFFTFRDLVFERGKRGVSVILPNVDLEHGLRMADEFRNKLRKSSAPAIASADIRIGLTARSGRLVDAERLMLEASRALSKAVDEIASPVVAFKPDPERYRSFIAARS